MIFEMPKLLPQWVAGCEDSRTFRAARAFLHYDLKDRAAKDIILPPNRKPWCVPEDQLQNITYRQPRQHSIEARYVYTRLWLIALTEPATEIRAVSAADFLLKLLISEKACTP